MRKFILLVFLNALFLSGDGYFGRGFSQQGENRKMCEGPQTVLTGPFLKLADYPGGNGYAIDLVSLSSISDDIDHKTRSPLILCEDGKPLGPAHTAHDEVNSMGRGRYSHWLTKLRFSASDNSDPNTNKRAYAIVVPR